jgi:hypothetical protein
MTPAGTVSDGNSGNNYAVTFVSIATGAITVRPIAVTAATSTKVYDGNASSTATPAITAGTLAAGAPQRGRRPTTTGTWETRT